MGIPVKFAIKDYTQNIHFLFWFNKLVLKWDCNSGLVIFVEQTNLSLAFIYEETIEETIDLAYIILSDNI